MFGQGREMLIIHVNIDNEADYGFGTFIALINCSGSGRASWKFEKG